MKFADYVSDRKVKLSPTWHTTLQKNVDCPALQHRPATRCLVPRASSILLSLDYHIAAQRSGPSPGQRPLRHPGLSSARCANLRSWKSCKTSAKSPPRAVQWSMCVVVCPLWRRCVIVNWLSSLWHQVSSIRYERLHKLNTSIVDFVTNVRVSPPKNENVKGLYPRVLWFLDCFMCEMRDVCVWMMRVNGIANFFVLDSDSFIYLIWLMTIHEQPTATCSTWPHVTLDNDGAWPLQRQGSRRHVLPRHPGPAPGRRCGGEPLQQERLLESLADGQVSCDWRRAGHVTSVLISDWSGRSTNKSSPTDCTYPAKLSESLGRPKAKVRCNILLYFATTTNMLSWLCLVVTVQRWVFNLTFAKIVIPLVFFAFLLLLHPHTEIQVLLWRSITNHNKNRYYLLKIFCYFD